MRNSAISGFLMFLLLTAPTVAREDEPITEEVKVVNLEIPVRVILKGEPVPGLTKKDFKLYEDRRPQKINGFYVTRKRITVQQTELEAQKGHPAPARYFVLVFRLTDYSEDFRKGVNFLFNNVIRETDRILAFVNNRSFFFKDLKAKESVRQQLHKHLGEQSREVRNRLLSYLKLLERELDITKFKLTLGGLGGRTVTGEPLHEYIHRFFKKYIVLWSEYKKNFLVPRVETYYNFARHLERIDLEKWVINFYQFELFPKIVLTSETMRRVRTYLGEWRISTDPEISTFARLIARQLVEIERTLSISTDFPAEEISRLFYSVDASFHSIFMRSMISTLAEDFQYRQVASDLENTLREITDATGGELVVSNRIETALKTIGEQEDIVYVLTYAPANPEEVGKIRVKTRNRKYKLLYDENIRASFMQDLVRRKEYTDSEVEISEITFEKKMVKLVVIGYARPGKQPGQISIRVQVTNRQGIPIFDEKKELTASEKRFKIDLRLSWMKKGRYNIVVDVTDMLSEKHDSAIVEANIQ